MVNYDEYMKSAEWDEKRQLRFCLDGYRCHECGSSINLQCHHITYERLGNEKMSDLITLCSKCHKKLHEPRPKKRPRSIDDNLRGAAKYAGCEEEMDLLILIADKLKQVMGMELINLFFGDIDDRAQIQSEFRILVSELSDFPKLGEVLNDYINKF